jgi:hypothetical protein
MAKKTTRQSRSYWTKVVAEYERRAGRETQEAFAQRRGLNVEALRYWLYKIRAAESDQPVRFVEVNSKDLTLGGHDVEIELCAGRCTVRLDSKGDAAWLGEIVEALAGRLGC